MAVLPCANLLLKVTSPLVVSLLSHWSLLQEVTFPGLFCCGDRAVDAGFRPEAQMYSAYSVGVTDVPVTFWFGVRTSAVAV